MKKINVLHLIAAICLLFGCVINLLEICIEIPLALSVCSLPLLLASVVLHIILLRRYTKKKQEKKDGEDGT